MKTTLKKTKSAMPAPVRDAFAAFESALGERERHRLIAGLAFKDERLSQSVSALGDGESRSDEEPCVRADLFGYGFMMAHEASVSLVRDRRAQVRWLTDCLAGSRSASSALLGWWLSTDRATAFHLALEEMKRLFVLRKRAIRLAPEEYRERASLIAALVVALEAA